MTIGDLEAQTWDAKLDGMNLNTTQRAARNFRNLWPSEAPIPGNGGAVLILVGATFLFWGGLQLGLPWFLALPFALVGAAVGLLLFPFVVSAVLLLAPFIAFIWLVKTVWNLV